MNTIQQQLNNEIYSIVSNKLYPFELNSDLVVEHTYQKINNDCIQIALDFFSDKSKWGFNGESRLGDFSKDNLGSDFDKTSYSKVKRFETKNADTNFIITCSSDETYQNGFFPNIVYIGNHNLEIEDEIIFKAYNDELFTSLAYSQKIEVQEGQDIFYINSRQFQKHKYFQIEINTAVPKVLKIGRAILAGSLPTNFENNAQKGISAGWTDHKDTMMTESKTMLFNRQFFARKLNFSIQIDINKQEKLASQIEQLIIEGTGSRPFLVVLNSRDPNYLSLYGVLTSESSFEHKELGYGLYLFDVEEIQ